MIKLIKEDGADKAADIAWSCQSEPETSAFPRYRSREAMRDEFLKILKQPDGQLLGCYDGETLKGVLCLYVDAEAKYGESVGGIFAVGGDAAVHAQFTEYLRGAYAGFELLFSYPEENETAAAAMLEAGAELYESSVTMRLNKGDFKQGQTGGVNKLGKERFADYAAFHDAAFPGAYWTAARIKDARDKWDVNVFSESGRICGSVFTAVWDEAEAEVFGVAVDAKHRGRGLEAKLLTRACAEAFRAGKKSVLFFIDGCEPVLLAAAKKCGFKPVSNYRCYRFNK